MKSGFTDDEVAQAEEYGLGPYRKYEVPEATEHLGIDEQAALKLIENNELESLKVGKKRFVLGGHIVRWKARHSDGPNGETPSLKNASRLIPP